MAIVPGSLAAVGSPPTSASGKKKPDPKKDAPEIP